MAVTAFVFKVIYAIPLWLTITGSRMTLRFLNELVGILFFRAKWWITCFFWILFIRVLIGFEPWIEENLGPVHAVYWRLIVGIMLLGVLAFVTRNLRRAFRRARLEIQVLQKVGGIRQHVVKVRKGNNSDDETGGDNTKMPSWISRIVAAIRQRSEVKDTVHIFTVEGDFKPGSYEESQAAQRAYEAAYLKASLGEGAFPQKERPDWMKSKSSKPGRANPTDTTGVDPLIRAQELEAEAERLRRSAKRTSDEE